MIKVVRGQGMPRPHGGFGDLFVEFDVVFPKILNGPEGGSMAAKDIAALKKILPRLVGNAPKPRATDKSEVHDMEELDPTRDGRNVGGDDGDEDDDEGREGVPCTAS